MSEQFIAYLEKYGLSGWAVVVIGGGTIIAALITSLNSLLVAIINQRSTRAMAADSAHRVYREQLVEPIRRAAREAAKVAIDIGGASRTDIETKQRELARWAANVAAQALASANLAIFTGTAPIVHEARHAMRTQLKELNSQLLAIDSGAAERADAWLQVKEHVELVTWITGTVEIACEGYVFGIRRLLREARRRLRVDSIAEMERYRRRLVYRWYWWRL